MRNSLHRAVLRRLLLRLSVLAAFALAFATVMWPATWLGGVEPALARTGLALLSVTLLAVPGALVLAAGRRPRARVTAPRAAVSGF